MLRHREHHIDFAFAEESLAERDRRLCIIELLRPLEFHFAVPAFNTHPRALCTHTLNNRIHIEAHTNTHNGDSDPTSSHPT
jgi:hypothetical protein